MNLIIYICAVIFVFSLVVVFMQFINVEGFQSPNERSSIPIEELRKGSIYDVFDLPSNYEVKKILHDYLKTQNNCHVDSNPFYYRLFIKSLRNYIRYNFINKIGKMPSDDSLQKIESNEYGMYKRMLLDLPPCEELVEKYMSINNHKPKPKKKKIIKKILPVRAKTSQKKTKEFRLPSKNIQKWNSELSDKKEPSGLSFNRYHIFKRNLV